MSIRTLYRSRAIPPEVKRAFRDSLKPNSPEQVLWREASVRHVLDAFGLVEQGEQEHVADARKWFLSRNPKVFDYVRLTFEYAGVDLAPILRALKERYDDGREISNMEAKRSHA